VNRRNRSHTRTHDKNNTTNDNTKNESVEDVRGDDGVNQRVGRLVWIGGHGVWTGRELVNVDRRKSGVWTGREQASRTPGVNRNKKGCEHYMLNTRSKERNTVFYAYLACFMNTLILYMYVLLSNQPEYGIRIRVAASQEYVNSYSTCTVWTGREPKSRTPGVNRRSVVWTGFSVDRLGR